uniref:Uncharacterized protein n=1 Tax=Neobodo designis TaxID=312471 RepID=A0A7S1M310_NEODS|mmetsp:Transcript_32983/g.101870  ORF Transcript_32983/g.101870 Transcript_32983/m.101870 type:complete len:181 (+) Transcript_32983:44-586(+)
MSTNQLVRDSRCVEKHVQATRHQRLSTLSERVAPILRKVRDHTDFDRMLLALTSSQNQDRLNNDSSDTVSTSSDQLVNIRSDGNTGNVTNNERTVSWRGKLQRPPRPGKCNPRRAEHRDLVGAAVREWQSEQLTGQECTNARADAVARAERSAFVARTEVAVTSQISNIRRLVAAQNDDA